MTTFTKIHPLRNTVMFKFLDQTAGSKGKFTDATASGIILTTGATNQKAHRWGQVMAVGPKVHGVEVGDYALVQSLMWTEGVVVDGEKLWKTDDQQILAVTNDMNTVYASLRQ